MDKASGIIGLALKAVALAMGVAVTALTILGQFNSGLNVLIGIGLFAISLVALINEK
jgi:hypothetical protein